MPYFPRDDDNTVVLTLKKGDTVTLVEKELARSERKAITKRTLLMQSEFEYKTRQAESVDKKIKAAALNKEDFDKASEEKADLMVSVDLFELYATILPMRFASWDVYASRADLEASKPVEMSRDAIVEFAYAKKQNGELLVEIIELLGEHDRGEEKKDGMKPDASGKQFTTTPAIQ